MASFNSSPSSSSSSVPTGRWTYEVFLSFRGEDTRNTFVDHLYAALVQRGVYTFKDDEMLRRGKPISPELLKAIEESRVAMVVFSENYVNSSWCLDELAKIMECQDRIGQRVLPVFYHVDPSDVRGQKGNFATAFQHHEQKFRGEPDKLKKWREALTAASSISGWHVKSDNGGESEFINKIVRDILGNVESHGTENNLIGIESHMDALTSLLDMEAPKEVRMVGIWGMGGIGKTTIAQALFRRISYKFEGSSFVKDVKENSSNKKDICAMQEMILRDVLMMHIHTIRNPDHGGQMIQRRFSNKKILLVLDDVDDNKQIEYLAATHEWFGPGSRIIITTRNEHVLSDANAKYEPGLLLMDQAVELFSRYAFKKNSPPEGYKELSSRAIHYTGYLPLALKVLGSFFHGRQAGVWDSALNRLAKAPNNEIFETLKLSYDGLDVSERKIFLDIACFFKGKDKEHVTRILDSFGFDPVIGISVLIEKSLITISKKSLDMHDLIQEMGWQIVRDSFSNSRIWQFEEMHLVTRNKKLKAIEAIVVRDKEYNVDHNDEKLGFSTEVFRSMKNLRLLDIDSNFTSHEPNFLPNELRWLCWDDYPYVSLPVAGMLKLVGLEMVDNYIQQLWEGQKILQNLKFIDLSKSHCLTRFPDVSEAPNIERLVLSDCTRLVEVHQSLGFHRRLVYLNMSGCWMLKCLPSRIEMESLETLILSYCDSLERFPEVSPCMEKLSNLYLDHCGHIEELPSSIRYLSRLSFLNLISCKNLKNIPNSICELRNLKSLHLHNCKNLQKLPDELGSMENLEELRLGFSEWGSVGLWEAILFRNLTEEHGSMEILEELEVGFPVGLREAISFRTLTSLFSLRKLDLSWRQIEEEDFPKNFHAFSSLEELNLSGNFKLIQLPVGISHLSHLKLLELNKCGRLQNLNALPLGIQVLKAQGCSSLEKIGDLSVDYEWLYKIWLLDCHKLLEDQENERHLDNMLQQSSLKKCAAVNHRLSIAIPGSKIPSWFKEQQHGCNVALKLPPKWHTQVIGFAICGVFHGDWKNACPRIIFRIVNDEKVIPNSEVDTVSAAADNGNLWVCYIPLGFFQQMYHDFEPQDWSHIEGDLVMTLTRTDGNKSLRCGAHVLYKEDVELIHELKTCIPDYGNLVQVDGDIFHEEQGYEEKASGNTYVYEEKSDDRNSQKRNLYDTAVSFTVTSIPEDEDPSDVEYGDPSDFEYE